MISIIIPTHNRRVYLEEALTSIVNQKNVDVEIIVVDDASTDNTEAYIKQLNLKGLVYVRNNKSLFAHDSRRRGYELAKGRYIVFMDDDDFYIDDSFFSRAEEILNENKRVSAVIGSTIQMQDNEYGKTIDLGGNGIVDNKEYVNGFGLNYKKPQSTLTAIFRKECLDNLDFKNFRMVNDTCIYLVGILKGDVYLYNKSVATYRMHSGNISKCKFKLAFIRDCLEAKKEIYEIAVKDSVLNDAAKWYGNQICQSAFYFISSSENDFLICMYIIIWILFRAKGAQYEICKMVYAKIKNRAS